MCIYRCNCCSLSPSFQGFFIIYDLPEAKQCSFVCTLSYTPYLLHCRLTLCLPPNTHTMCEPLDHIKLLYCSSWSKSFQLYQSASMLQPRCCDTALTRRSYCNSSAHKLLMSNRHFAARYFSDVLIQFIFILHIVQCRDTESVGGKIGELA